MLGKLETPSARGVRHRAKSLVKFQAAHRLFCLRTEGVVENACSPLCGTFRAITCTDFNTLCLILAGFIGENSLNSSIRAGNT
jgi:hypothetical protein